MAQKVIKLMIFFILLIFSSIAIVIEPKNMVIDIVCNNKIQLFVTLLISELGDIKVTDLLMVPFVSLLLYKAFFKMKKSMCAIIASFILSVCYLIGLSFSSFHNADFIFGRKAQFTIAIIVLVGIWSILYSLNALLYQKIDGIKNKGKEIQFSSNTVFVSISNHFYLFCFAMLILLWLLQILPFFPGSIPHDGRYQLNQFFGYTQMNLHHPYYATILMGTIYKIGHKIGGGNFGCFLYVIFQSFIGAMIFGAICNYIKEKTGSLIGGLSCLLFYAFTPMWWTYMQTVDKDTIYFLMFSLFVLEYIRIILDDFNNTHVFLFIISSLCCCLFRNESKFIVFPIIIVLFIVTKRKKTVLLSASVVAIIYILLNIVIINFMGLKSDNQVEALSVPLQQIARVVVEYEEELLDTEKETIDRVVEYDGIKDRYDPECADPIKNYYKNTSEEEWDAFWNLWRTKLIEHPDVYISATLNNVYGYIYPGYNYCGLSKYQLYIKEPFNKDDNAGYYAEYYFSDSNRGIFQKIAYSWDDIPVLSLFTNLGTYVWALIVIFFATIRKKSWLVIIILIIPFLCIGVCMVSPVNGLLRYMLPVMATMPLYICLCYLLYKNKLYETILNN